MENIPVNFRERHLWCRWGVWEKLNCTKNFVWKSEACMLSKNKGIILKLTLEVSAVACRLDSSGCVHRYSDGTTVPDWAMLSVRDSEIATQYFQNLKIAAAHYYRQYYTGLSEHCAVAVWPGGIQPAEREQRCDVIIWWRDSPENLRRNPQLKPQAHCDVMRVV